MFTNTKPSDDTCGRTTSATPGSIFSVVVFAVSAAPPVPVLLTVPVDGSLTRRIVKLWIVAATLFMVTTRGRLTTLPLPASSRAVKRTARSCAPLSDPSARSSAAAVPGPKPEPNDAGTGKSARKGTDPVPELAGGALPPTPTGP